MEEKMKQYETSRHMGIGKIYTGEKRSSRRIGEEKEHEKKEEAGRDRCTRATPNTWGVKQV